MLKIQPCLWFEANCEEALNFYISIFPNSRIDHIQRYPSGYTEGPLAGMEGKIITALFTLDGMQFQALDGGPLFKLNPSISFFVNFDSSRDPAAAAQLHAMWTKLSEGGTVRMPLQEYPFSKIYGWIEDRFGVNWQLILTNPAGEPRPNIIPSLLFTKEKAGRAEEALTFYANIFKDSKMGTVAKYPDGVTPEKAGSVMFGEVQLEGQWFAAMDSAAPHEFSFNEALSFSVETADQIETDYYWDALTADGGSPSQCGWLKDKFGISWQIVPSRLGQMLTDPDKEKADRALQAMMGMGKIDIGALEKAYNG